MKAKAKNYGMKWPATRKELYAWGYTRDIQKPARKCKRCPAMIELWQTPTKTWMPLEVTKEDKNLLICHFATCPNANEFRRDDWKPAATQAKLFE